ncbi:hypothetical protein [Caballeronia hypogeia]|uniref:hypothetical protein n=1 Tax=Caballeronia hypogeia TaxID=1777140 RepID=UPI0012FD05BB|nr:hypothetical protein [Caballeronia hypogeia]
MSACGGSDGGLDSTPGVKGSLSYEFVPTAIQKAADGTFNGKLDYANTEKRPVRHALVEAVSEDGKSVLAKTYSSETGGYSMKLPGGTRAYVRVTAQVSDGPESAPDYLVKARDNTAPEYAVSPNTAPLYSMRGGVFETPQLGKTQVDLNAASGWTGKGYGAPRTAAPFAMLDQMVTAAQKMRATAPEVKLPLLNVFWSINNRPSGGELNDPAKGLLSATHHTITDNTEALYIKGAENVDTDEYDSSVVLHEFGHYVESSVSRSDNMGGSHSVGEALEIGTAFSEAWGNAFSSMVRDSPYLANTNGPLQAQTGYVLSFDEPPKIANQFWFDEMWLSRTLFQAYKSPDIGFAPIYRAMLGGQKVTPAIASIFSFATVLRPGLSDAGKTKLDQLLADIKVTSGNTLDAWGTATAANDLTAALKPAVVPIYLPLTPGTSGTSCSSVFAGTPNKLGNRGQIRLTVPAVGQYRITAASAPNETKPANDYTMRLVLRGKPINPTAGDDTPNGFVATFPLPEAGDYVATVFPEKNMDMADPAIDSVPRCLTVALERVAQ